MLHDAAHVLKRPATGRLLVDWVQLGLVPAPVKHGLGRGKGTSSAWTRFARDAWLDQLLKRERGESITALCNAAVWQWFTHPDGVVSARQVERALLTWSERQSSTGSRLLATSVDRHVFRVAHPGATDHRVREVLRVTLSDPGPGDPVAMARLAVAIRDVVAPGESGRAHGWLSPDWAARQITRNVMATMAGLRQVKAQAVSGHDLERARVYVLAATEQHANDPAAREVDQRLGAIFEPVASERRDRACADMIDALGTIDLVRRGVLTT